MTVNNWRFLLQILALLLMGAATRWNFSGKDEPMSIGKDLQS